MYVEYVDVSRMGYEYRSLFLTRNAKYIYTKYIKIIDPEIIFLSLSLSLTRSLLLSIILLFQRSHLDRYDDCFIPAYYFKHFSH